jgi:hypothetical protein
MIEEGSGQPEPFYFRRKTMGQASTLWAVKLQDRTKRDRVTPFTHLWILAADANTAVSKAHRWMKRNDFVGWKVSSVEIDGEIDVF